jgi:hypothetical protein
MGLGIVGQVAGAATFNMPACPNSGNQAAADALAARAEPARKRRLALPSLVNVIPDRVLLVDMEFPLSIPDSGLRNDHAPTLTGQRFSAKVQLLHNCEHKS